MSFANIPFSRIWHGSALLESKRGKQNQRLLLVLGFHLYILRRPLLCQDIYPTPVSASLRTEELPDRLLHPDRCGHDV